MIAKQGFQKEQPWLKLEGRVSPGVVIVETRRADGTRHVTTKRYAEKETLVADPGQRVTAYHFNHYSDGVQHFTAPERWARLDNGY